MRQHGCRPSTIVTLLFLLGALLLTACETATPTSASNELRVGDCVSVTDLGEDDAAPVKRVPCGPAGTPFAEAEFTVYRIAISVRLDVPVMSRSGADDLARLYCRGPEIVPGSSLYVFPTEASFAAGFTQFFCLVR